MPASPAPAWSTALGDAIRGGDADGAMRAGLAAVEAKVAPVEIARPAALAYGESVDTAKREPLRGLLALSAAVRLSRTLGTRLKALPVLRALTLAAGDAKVRPSERRRPRRVSGEISHLTRSFEYAVRTGAFEDAVSIFSGLLVEGKERVMAGDILFRVAAEDGVGGGHKLVYAVKAWQLASALGWRGGDVVMGPVVARVATGIQDDSAYRTIMGAWGREKVDVAAVGGNAGPAEGPDREAIVAALRASTPEESAKAVVLALKRGVAPDALASLVVREGAFRVASAAKYDPGAIGSLVFSDAARGVLRFSKTESRVLPVLQSCLLLRAQPAARGALRERPQANVEAALRDLAACVEASKDLDAAELAQSILAKGAPAVPVVETLVRELCKDGPGGNLGPNLVLADAAVEAATAYAPPVREALVALARGLAQSPRDRSGWPAVEAALGPAITSS